MAASASAADPKMKIIRSVPALDDTFGPMLQMIQPGETCILVNRTFEAIFVGLPDPAGGGRTVLRLEALVATSDDRRGEVIDAIFSAANVVVANGADYLDEIREAVGSVVDLSGNETSDYDAYSEDDGKPRVSEA